MLTISLFFILWIIIVKIYNAIDILAVSLFLEIITLNKGKMISFKRQLISMKLIGLIFNSRISPKYIEISINSSCFLLKIPKILSL